MIKIDRPPAPTSNQCLSGCTF